MAVLRPRLASVRDQVESSSRSGTLATLGVSQGRSLEALLLVGAQSLGPSPCHRPGPTTGEEASTGPILGGRLFDLETKPPLQMALRRRLELRRPFSADAFGQRARSRQKDGREFPVRRQNAPQVRSD
jgi:hypothetical protein